MTAKLGLCFSAAILRASPNRLNAWRLLKILLSGDIQGGHDPEQFDLPYLRMGFPVRRDSIKAYLSDRTAGDLTATCGEEEEKYIELVQSPTEAYLFPVIYYEYIREEVLPYVRGERPWEDCYKRFLNTLELYASE